MAGPESPPLKLLFVCSQNRRRSLTAEHVFAGQPGLEARSAGTERFSRIRVTAGHLGWADWVFVMERKHADYLREKFPETLSTKRLVCLRIPDEYLCDDPELARLLRQRVAEHLCMDEPSDG